MILLDTNVLSEPLRRAPEPRVVAWIDAQPMETLFVSAITVAELRAGAALLPAGKRRAVEFNRAAPVGQRAHQRPKARHLGRCERPRRRLHLHLHRDDARGRLAVDRDHRLFAARANQSHDPERRAFAPEWLT